jgi:hypothetical protein
MPNVEEAQRLCRASYDALHPDAAPRVRQDVEDALVGLRPRLHGVLTELTAVLDHQRRG